MKQIDRDALREWEAFLEDIRKSTPVDASKTPAEIERHRLYLEAHPIEWMLYMFPLYTQCSFAKFQVRAIHRILNNDEWYEVLSWSRELSKSTVVMFIVLYLVLTGKKHNVILTSYCNKNAVRLLAPYKAELETNRRIQAYYGDQQNIGNWTEEEFVTKNGAAFRALGAGQSPRGSRYEARRPDVLLMDDIDADDDVLNPDIIEKRWSWFEKAVYPTRSISEPTLVIWCGNIIAKDCCVTRAGAMADHWDIVDIRDENGVSTWPEKNSEEHIDRVLSQISTKAAQGEYFNNPVVEGTVFKVGFGKIPPLKHFPFLVAYGDPTQSEQKGRSGNKKGSRKAVWLCGMVKDTLYVIKGYIFKGANQDFINDYFLLNDWVGGRAALYCFIENNSLQDPFFQQVFRPIVAQHRKKKGVNLSILPDEEKKPDKAVRIEANLEPLAREGRIILNIDEKDDPNMQELKNEFDFFTLAMNYPADGIDCVEGAKRIIERKMTELAPPVILSARETRSFNKYRM